jgi:AcrR family transcriptional regulator
VDNGIRACTIGAMIKRPRKHLPAEQRKASIAQAALPLFASRGFDGVSTRELAEASGVSEALIFRYFPSKRALFDEILRQHTERRGFSKLHATIGPTSTAALVKLVFLFVHGIVVTDAEKAASMMRLFYRSFLEDGDMARNFLHSAPLLELRKTFDANLAAARLAGDATALATHSQDLFWLVQHVATAACLVRLPRKVVLSYRMHETSRVEEITLFALRGIGLTESALSRYATPDQLRSLLRDSTASERKPEK